LLRCMSPFLPPVVAYSLLTPLIFAFVFVLYFDLNYTFTTKPLEILLLLLLF